MKKIYFLSLALPLSLAVLLQACGGDGNPAPGDDGDPQIPQGGSPGSGGQTSSGGGGPVDGSGGSIAPPPDREACPEEADGTQPSGPIAGKACWKLEDCNATEQQFLEQCSSGCLEPFDNRDKIQGYTGTLPPLRD